MTDVVVAAKVNHGRWIAPCPFCGGAERVWPNGRLQTSKAVPFAYGIQDSRLHCGFTGHTAKVVFPVRAADIWKLLRRRPDIRNRNWEPHETLTDLQRENRDQGVKV